MLSLPCGDACISITAISATPFPTRMVMQWLDGMYKSVKRRVLFTHQLSSFASRAMAGRLLTLVVQYLAVQIPTLSKRYTSYLSEIRSTPFAVSNSQRSPYALLTMMMALVPGAAPNQACACAALLYCGSIPFHTQVGSSPSSLSLVCDSKEVNEFVSLSPMPNGLID